MGGAIALEFDPSHQHRLHGHQLARNDISTALVDEFDLARLFDHHPTVTPMSLYHVLAHKLDVYCTTLLLPSQRNLVAQQSTRQRLSALNAALQSKGLITLFPGYDDDGGKDSPTTSATSEVSAGVREDSAEAHVGSPGKPKSEFHRVDDARCVVLFLTADYLAALQPAPPAAHDAQHNTIATDAAENSLNTLMSSEHGTMRSSGEPRAHSPAPHHSIRPSPSDLRLNALADEDVRARDRAHREFLYIQRSLPATKIVPVVVDAAAAHVADWPLPLQRLYYPHLFLHQSSGLGGGAANGPTPEYFQHHPLTHLVQCQAHELPPSSSSSSLFAAYHQPHGDSGCAPPPTGLASAASFSLLRSASHHASAASSAQVERLFDTVLRVVKLPLRPLIQEEMDRVLARSASLPSSVKLAMGELSSLANGGDHSVLSTSSRNSSRPQSSSRRSFTLPALSPTASQSRVGGDAAALHLDGRSQSPLTGGGALPASTPLVSSVIHFFVVEGRIAPAKAREYALTMAQQDHLESVPALKHHIQHHHPDYLQMRLGMTELEAKRMLQLLLQATGDVLEVRRRRSLGGGEISSTMMTSLSNAAAAQLQSAADSHGGGPGGGPGGGEHSDNDDDHTVNSASQRTDSRKAGGGLGGARLGSGSGKAGSAKLAAARGSGSGSVGPSGGSNKQAQRRRSDGGSYFFDPTASVDGGHGAGGSMVQMVMSRVSSLMTASASQPNVQPPRSRSHSPSASAAAAADDASPSAGGSAKQAAVAAPAEEK
eukprot:gene2929-2139_t